MGVNGIGARLVLALVAIVLAVTPCAAQPIDAAATRSFTHPSRGLTVVAADLMLPPGQWEVTSIVPPSVLDQVFVIAQMAPESAPTGRRVQTSEIEKMIESGRWRVQQFYGACRDYAQTHAGIGPNSFADLDPVKYRYVIQSVGQSPWPEDAGKGGGPFYFLIPDVAISTTAGIPRESAPRGTPLVLELRPYVDDGKHWVLYADGRAERVPIDPVLVARYRLTISSVKTKASPAPTFAPSTIRHTMLGALRSPTVTTATVHITDAMTGRHVAVRWSLAGARPDSQIFEQWSYARAREWLALVEFGDATILRAWAARMPDTYGSRLTMGTDFAGIRDPRRTTDAFNLLGGRAAVRETLQMELLRSGPNASEAATVPISTLKAVEVKSLPFDEMLAGRPGARLPLAESVPADRLFVYFAKPSAVFPFLEQGADFLGRAGSLFTQSYVDDNLKNRYLRRLGLGEALGRRFLESGEVVELALVAPDLFFIDGTELTIVMRLRAPDRVVGTLRALGIIDLRPDGITEKPVASGRAAYWARHGDLLLLGTSRAELDGIMAVRTRPTADSLGRTAEFRYLLTQLPVKRDTRAFLYLSDPFIRRMVGPAVKIAQLRRMRARAEMEIVAAGALLAVADGTREKPDLGKLMSLGYVPRTLTGQYVVRDDLSVASPIWGTLAEMAALDPAAIDKVTPSEARAYQSYVDEYSRYWRQYFDPIAFRLDDAPGGALEVSTFILPLLDSQIYNQLREILAPREKAATLRVPVVSPEPVMLLSLNLTDESWVKISGSWSQMFSQYTGINPAIFDRLGPGAHIAIQDADPVVTLGNADLMGAFGGALFTQGGMQSGFGGFALPLLASVLTRPTKIFIELQDPKGTLELMRQSTKSIGRRRELMVEFRQVEGRDAWIYAINVPGVAKIRFGIEINNGYLILSNIPWSQPVTVKAIESRELNGAAIQFAPGAVRQGLPGLYATQSEQNQLAALKSMAALYPLLLSVSATPEDAATRHAAIFGSKPLHPGPGTWVWKNGKLESSLYGSATRWKEPIYRPEMGDFGLFEGVTQLGLNMQLESGGLRAIVRWKTK